MLLTWPLERTGRHKAHPPPPPPPAPEKIFRENSLELSYLVLTTSHTHASQNQPGVTRLIPPPPPPPLHLQMFLIYG
jgi:hypothetical protein